MGEIIVALNNPSKEDGAKELTEVAVKPIVVTIIEIIIFIIAFTLLMIIVKILSNIISKTINFVPLVGTANKILGGVLGLAQGAFIVLILTLIIKALVSITNNELTMFNSSTIEETYLFKLIYDLKLFK